MSDSELEKSLLRLQSILDATVQDGVPGLSAAVQTSKGERHFLHAGFSDYQAKKPIDRRSTFGVGSITKVFVAVVVLQLAEEKKLGLNDQVHSILTSSIMEKVHNADTARIRDLLSHTSAIASWEDDPEWIRAGRGENIQPMKIWRKDETLDFLKPSASDGLEKGLYHYANTNYTLLGLIIEKITQNTAESEIRRRVIEPLRMQNTYLEGFERPSPTDQTPRRYHWITETFRQVAGISPHFHFVRHDLVDVTASNLSVSWTAGGMISNPSDLLKFASALTGGVLISPASMEILMQWHDAGEDMEMGHGIFRLRRPAAPGLWVGHNGGVLGFTAALWWDAKSGCTVAVLANVGSSHAGAVPSNAGRVALKTDFLGLAALL